MERAAFKATSVLYLHSGAPLSVPRAPSLPPLLPSPPALTPPHRSLSASASPTCLRLLPPPYSLPRCPSHLNPCSLSTLPLKVCSRAKLWRGSMWAIDSSPPQLAIASLPLALEPLQFEHQCRPFYVAGFNVDNVAQAPITALARKNGAGFNGRRWVLDGGGGTGAAGRAPAGRAGAALHRHAT